MLWSILICGIPERYHSVQPLLYSLLEKQSVARMPDVELLYFMDNRRRSVGAKRNDLLRAARGEYISFIDDDDDVSDKYVSDLHDAIVRTRKKPIQQLDCSKCGGHAGFIEDCKVCHGSGKGPIAGPVDVICFPQRATLLRESMVHECSYSLSYWRDRKPDKRRLLTSSGTDGVLNWTGPPAHTMVWQVRCLTKPSSIADPLAQRVLFPEKNFGEDVEWVDGACEKAQTEMKLIGPPLYFYNFDSRRTATR